MSNPYDSPLEQSRPQRSDSGTLRDVFFGLGLGIAANVVVIVSCLEFLEVEPGAIIKPFFGNPFPMLGGLVAFFVALPLRVFGLIRNRSRLRWLGIPAAVLAVTPIPLCAFLLNYFATTRGFFFEN